MELEHLVADPHAGGPQPGDGGVEVVDREADVVEPEAGQVGLVGVGSGLGPVEPEELDLLVGGDDRGARG